MPNSLNTSINSGNRRDVYKRQVLKLYRDLGGQYITTGSDAHRSDRVAKRINEAEKLAAAAGIPLIATFQRMKPIFHPLGSI